MFLVGWLVMVGYCQAKVQVQVQSLKSKAKSKVKSKVLSLGTWTLAYTKIIQPTHHPPPLNFSSTSRGPIVKCYTFLETSHDPLLELQVISNFFLKFEIMQPLPIRKDLNKYKHFQGFFLSQTSPSKN